jgi:hypothetical protein
MTLVEGEHFHLREIDQDNDDVARAIAERSFLDMINQLDNEGDLHEYVQSKIVSASDN